MPAQSGSGPATKGGLVPAKIYEVDDQGNKLGSSQLGIINCAFNPYRYTISLSNNFNSVGLDENKNFRFELNQQNISPRTLTINELWFDTYEAWGSYAAKSDVREITDKLTGMAELRFNDSQPQAKPDPPKVAFEWGSFRFLAVIQSLTLEFNLFLADGTPVRAKADITFKEFKHRKSYPKQNPTSGDGALNRIWRITVGDRLDLIANQVYGDASKWRLIADQNQIENPFALRIGQELIIPAIE